MSLDGIISNTPELRTRQSLAEDLRRLGLYEGMTVIVHSSLSSLGWVNGGAIAVIQALMDAVTSEGTIVMPAHSGDNSDPSHWSNPPVPEAWWPAIRETMPAFEPRITPTSSIGKVAELFRSFEGVVRSAHPAVSFTAWGKNAEFITGKHALDFSLGENSPLARIYELDGWVLLLGIGHANNTSFHLAEYRAAEFKKVKEGAPVMEEGKRVWKEYEDIELNSDVFSELGSDYEMLGKVIKGPVGSGVAKLFKQAPAVDFAADWIARMRNTAKEA